MNKHLQYVREFHENLGLSQAVFDTASSLSDIEIIRYQALLMDKGSEVLTALAIGEMTDLTLRLIHLAYAALAAIALQGEDVIDQPAALQQNWSVLSVMQEVSDKINQCSSGSTKNYSAIYALSIHLVRGFINADFDKAFAIAHRQLISGLKECNGSRNNDMDHWRKLKLLKTPDMSECLYE